MQINNLISQIKAIFKNTLLKHDKRCKIQSLEFVAALICSIVVREGRVLSISALRHAVMAYTCQTLSRSTFWERLSTKKIVTLLKMLLGTLMSDLCFKLKISAEILETLSVKSIVLLDSSTFSLPNSAKGVFPAPRNNVAPAALKLHALYDLFGGIIQWFQMTPATTHDRKAFPPFHHLVGSLVIFDLGYWDYQLLLDMIRSDVFFLCRVKSNATIKIVEVIEGIAKTCIGKNVCSKRLASFRGDIVECVGEITIRQTGESFHSRVIGFWSREDGQYHWYITNLKVSAIVIYPLYRLRWQLELLWKAWKSFLHLDEIQTADKNIILCVMLAGMCAGLLTGGIGIATISNEPEEKQVAFSVQKTAALFIRIGYDLFKVICTNLRSAKKRLIEMIILFKDELYDPNYKRRNNSLCQFKQKMEMI
jgi:hypothetical protein